MPLLNIHTNISINEANKDDFLRIASSKVAEILAKSEKYVMIRLQSNCKMLFGDSNDPLALLELKSINLPEGDTPELSQALCELVTAHLNIDQQRIYIEFHNAERHLWGWNGQTF